jgi:hypothetical protein
MGKVLRESEEQMLVDVDEVLKGQRRMTEEEIEQAKVLQDMSMRMLDEMILHGLKPADVGYVCAVIIARTCSMVMPDSTAKLYIETLARVTQGLFRISRGAMRKASGTDPEMRRLLQIIDASDPTAPEGAMRWNQ